METVIIFQQVDWSTLVPDLKLPTFSQNLATCRTAFPQRSYVFSVITFGELNEAH